MTAAEVMSELTYQIADLRLQQDVDVILEGEVLRPQLHAGPHDLVLGLKVVTSPQ